MADVFLIKKPWVTEKSTALAVIGKYVFVVNRTRQSRRSRKR